MRTFEVLIQPIGEVQPDLIGELSGSLEEILPVSCLVQPRIDLPNRAFFPDRSQYLADYLLHVLDGSPRCRNGRCKILGVTSADIFALGRTFVFGQAIVAGNAAIISTRRLMRKSHEPHYPAGMPQFATERQDLLRRTAKEAVHEIGHTLGLPHCTDPGCVMSFSESLIQADQKDLHYCGRCLDRLTRAA